MVRGGAGAEAGTAASLYVAYPLWLVGGAFGLHHFYLGDDNKAFVYAITFGGFGFGWLRDLWCLPSYVRALNAPDEPQPWPRRKSFFLMAGLFAVSHWLGRIATLALAPSWLAHPAWEIIVRSVACALGAYLIGHSRYPWLAFRACVGPLTRMQLSSHNHGAILEACAGVGGCTSGATRVAEHGPLPARVLHPRPR